MGNLPARDIFASFVGFGADLLDARDDLKGFSFRGIQSGSDLADRFDFISDTVTNPFIDFFGGPFGGGLGTEIFFAREYAKGIADASRFGSEFYSIRDSFQAALKAGELKQAAFNFFSKGTIFSSETPNLLRAGQGILTEGLRGTAIFGGIVGTIRGVGNVAQVLKGAGTGASTLRGLQGAEDAFRQILRRVDKLDFSTRPNEAVFYSGSGQFDRAEAFAKGTGRKIIDMTKGGQELLKDPLFQSLSREQKYLVWQKASVPFAEGASGNVNAFVKGASAEKTFRSIEEPILRKGKRVYKYRYWY